MKSKWYFISSVFQIVVGLLAIVSFIVMAINGDLETRWVVTLILAIAFVVMGVLGVLDNRRYRYAFAEMSLMKNGKRPNLNVIHLLLRSRWRDKSIKEIKSLIPILTRQRLEKRQS